MGLKTHDSYSYINNCKSSLMETLLMTIFGVLLFTLIVVDLILFGAALLKYLAS